MNRTRALTFLVLLAAVGSWAQTTYYKPVEYSMSDVTVAPTRVVFEGAARTGEVAPINLSDKTLTYSVSFSHIRMSDTGQMREVTDSRPGELFADDLVRFTPRRVTLEPHQTQIVRLQLRLPADLPDGEYRSHLAFKVVPAVTQEAGSPQQNAGQGISIQLTPVYGVSIPVIVRHGPLNAQVGLSSLQMTLSDADSHEVTFHIDRSGTESVYGNVEVRYTPASGPSIVVGKLNGLAVYAPNILRIVSVPLTIPEGTILKGGRAVVRYSDAAGATMAEAEIAVP